MAKEGVNRLKERCKSRRARKLKEVNSQEGEVLLQSRLQEAHHRQGKSTMETIAEVALFVFFVSYFELTTEIFGVFSCVTVNGVAHMSEMPWIECSVAGGGLYAWLFSQAVVFTLVYVVGFLCIIAVLLWRNFERRDQETSISFLHHEYKIYWFELVLMSRRLLISLFLALDKTSVYLDFLIQAVLTGSLVLHISMFPFLHVQDNMCETAVLAVLTISFSAVTNKRTEASFPYFVLALNIMVVVGLVCVMVFPFVKKIRQKCKTKKTVVQE